METWSFILHALCLLRYNVTAMDGVSVKDAIAMGRSHIEVLGDKAVAMDRLAIGGLAFFVLSGTDAELDQLVAGYRRVQATAGMLAFSGAMLAFLLIERLDAGKSTRRRRVRAQLAQVVKSFKRLADAFENVRAFWMRVRAYAELAVGRRDAAHKGFLQAHAFAAAADCASPWDEIAAAIELERNFGETHRAGEIAALAAQIEVDEEWVRGMRLIL